MHSNARANGVASPGRKLQTRDDSDPIVRVAGVVAQEFGVFVLIDDDEIDVAVVVVIEAGAPRPTYFSWKLVAGGGGHVFELAVAKVSDDGVLLHVLVMRVAVDGEDIEPTIVVEVEEHGGPTGVLPHLLSDAGLARLVLKPLDPSAA